MTFKAFSSVIATRIKQMQTEHDVLYIVDLSPSDLWDTYLAAFPPGTNPIYKTNTEHDCYCCRNFIRDMGATVAISNHTLQTIWSVPGLPEPYATVAAALDQKVLQGAIQDIFVTTEENFGHKHTIQLLGESCTKKWNHFYCEDIRPHQVSGSTSVRIHLRTALTRILNTCNAKFHMKTIFIKI